MREERTVDKPLSWSEVERALDARPGLIVRALVRPAGGLRFAVLPPGDGVPAGATLVLYRVDPAEPGALSTENRAFEDRVYTSSLGDAVADERALIAERLPARGATVLEVCCGNGRVTPHLVREGNRVLGVDRSRDAVGFALATDRAGVSYLAADAAALPLGDDSVDFACIFENSLGVLFEQQLPALGELVRVARRSVILGLRALERPPSDGRYDVYVSPGGYLEVVQTFTPAQGRALVEQLPPSLRARVVGIEQRPGHERPWGGTEHFLLLALS